MDIEALMSDFHKLVCSASVEDGLFVMKADNPNRRKQDLCGFSNSYLHLKLLKADREKKRATWRGAGMNEMWSMQDVAETILQSRSPCSPAVLRACCHNSALHHQGNSCSPLSGANGDGGAGGTSTLHHRTCCAVPGGERLKKMEG